MTIPRPGADGPRAVAALTSLIMVLCGLAVLPLLAAIVMTMNVIFDAGVPDLHGALFVGWLLAALFLSVWNVLFGLRVLREPSWRRVAWLYGPTLLLILAGLPFLLRLAPAAAGSQ
jgi:hypothetical protein